METINTMKTFRFYKEQTNRWYADFPDWRGTHDELEMISGADTFLNIMAEGSSEIHVILSDESFENSDLLAIKQYGRSDGWELGEGAWYSMPSYQGIKYPDFEMWLCAVTKFVFGDFPEIIYFSKDANRSSFPEVKEKIKLSVANIPQNLISGVESFGTKQEANSEAKKLLGNSPHSIDMIDLGIRTRTTRSVGEMEKYNIKVGDIVKQFGKSADGTTKQILTKITAIHPKGTTGFLGTWNKEGWTQEGIKAIERFKDGAAAIEFKVID